MAVANAYLRQLSEAERRLLEGWLLEFDQAWTEGRLDERVRALPPATAPLRRAALAELVKIDLERQWRAGRRPALEDYLRRFPELGTPDAVAADLIQAEYEVRRQFGAPADLAELRRRFPRQAGELQRLLSQARAVVSDNELAQRSRDTESSGATPSGPGLVPAGQELPEQFGRYRIGKCLGRGGMGAVYLAHDTQLDRRVALKVPHFGPADGPRIRARFYREARAAAVLDHPNLCPVHDVGEIDGVPYLTMAYVEGRPLSAFIRPDRPLTPVQAATVVRKIARALQEAHARGIIHRDLKPANVMINARGEPVVMDFGLARRTHQREARLTPLGSILGTPAYMPPEQVTGDIEAMGPACDIYSLGVILYELLTGRVPFEGDVVAVLFQSATDPPPPPSQYRPDLDPRLEAVCLKALAKKPEDRQASMADLARDLGEYLRAAAPATATTAVVAPVAPPPRRPRRAWIAAAAAGAVLLFGIIIYITTKKGTTAIHVDDPDARVQVKSADDVTNAVGMKLIAIPAGKFLMGAADGEAGAQASEGPRHWVEIAQPFHLGAGEVTQEQYEKVMGTNPCWFCAQAEGKEAVAGQDTRQFPVEMVSWEDAAAFCRKLSRLPPEQAAKRVYRLPTEAEWEYVCRAGAASTFAFGGSLTSRQANIDGRFPYGGSDRGPFLGRTTAVGSYPANGWGIRDMHGNVWEWCSDHYGPAAYGTSPPADPRGPAAGDSRVVRGGGWFDIHPAERRDDWRCANRGYYPPGTRRNDLGFRVVCVPAAREPGLADEPSPSPPPADPAPPAAAKPVDLLALLDLQNTYVRGEWQVRQGALVAPATQQAQVQLPYEPPDEYRLEMVVERNGYKNTLSFGITVAGRPALVCLDGWEGRWSGLGLIDGRDVNANETTHEGTVLPDGKPCRVVCTVRRNRVVVTCDNRTVLDWAGASDRLTLHPEFPVPNRNALYLRTWTGYTISRLELTPLSGPGRRLEAAAGEVRCLPVGGQVHGLALAPDGRRLLVGSSDWVLRSWDVTTGRLLRTFEGHHGGMWNGVALTHGGRCCLSASTDETIRLWDAATGRDLQHFVGHVGAIWCLAVAPDGRRFLSSGDDGILHLWRLPPEPGRPADDGHGLRAELFDGIDLKNKLAERIDDQIDAQYYESSPDPDRLLPNSYSMRWTGWLKPPVKGRYHFTLHSDDGVRFWLDGKPFLDAWNAGTATYHAETELSDEPHALRIEYYQGGGPAALVWRWSLAGGFAEQPVPRGCLFHDEAIARTAAVKLTDEVRRLNGHQGTVWGVAFAPNNRHALSAGEDGTVRLWDVDSGKELRRFEGHRGPVWAVAVAPDGRRALTGGSDQTLRLWDVGTGRELRRFLGHRAGVRSVAFAADGRRAVSGGLDATVRVWDLDTDEEPRKEVCCFRGHTAWVHTVAFAADGRRVYSGSYDGTVRAWAIPPVFPETPPAPPGRPVDLLKQLDLAEQFVRGDWKLADGTLTSPAEPEALVQLPYAPPEEYRLDLVVRRVGRHEGLGLGLVTGGNCVLAMLDGDNGTHSGLDLIDGQGYRANDSTYSGRALKDDGPNTVTCTVRRDRITVTCDGRPVLAWKGDPRRLSLFAPATRPDPQALFLQTWASYTISKMELTPLAGDSRRREEPWGEVRRIPQPGNSVAFTPEGRRVVIDWGRFFRLWDLPSDREVWVSEGHGRSVWRTVLSPDGRLLVTGGEDGDLRLWDAATGEQVYHLPGHPASCVRGLAFVPDGRSVVSAADDGTVRLWPLPDLGPGEQGFLAGHGLRAQYFEGTDLKKKVGEGIDHALDWRREWRSPHARLGREHYSVRWTGWLKAPRAGRYTLSLPADDGVRLRLDDRLVLDRWQPAAPDQYRVEVALTDQPHRLQIEYYQVTGPAVLGFRWAQAGGFAEQAVPAEALFPSEAAAGQAEVRLPAEARRFEGHRGTVWAVTCSSGGRRLLTGGEDGTVRLWDVASGKELRRFEGHTGAVRGVAVAADGRRAASAGSDRDVRVWDLDTGETLARLRGHRAEATSVAFTPDGRLLSGSDDGTLRLWDVKTKQLIHSFEGHTDRVRSVAVAADGRRAASASWDGSVRVWRLPPP